jgi:hypothetical protein
LVALQLGRRFGTLLLTKEGGWNRKIHRAIEPATDAPNSGLQETRPRKPDDDRRRAIARKHKEQAVRGRAHVGLRPVALFGIMRFGN